QLAKDEVTDVGHIERALKAKATRTGRVSARILEDILAGVILIDSEGAAIGKCNGLTVLEVGDSAFGLPARISTTVYPGGSGIVDIEREVNLGQPIHSKGDDDPHRLSGQPLCPGIPRSEEHTSELQSRENLVCRLLLEK